MSGGGRGGTSPILTRYSVEVQAERLAAVLMSAAQR